METFNAYLAHIDNLLNRARVEEVLTWVQNRFPELIPRIAWNQPMFTHHGTFIVGFSVSKHHLAVAPENVAITRFAEDIQQSGYDYSKELIRIRWEDPVDFDLLERIIQYNMQDKADCVSFWRR